jgi:hypothetical protein
MHLMCGVGRLKPSRRAAKQGTRGDEFSLAWKKPWFNLTIRVTGEYGAALSQTTGSMNYHAGMMIIDVGME